MLYRQQSRKTKLISNDQNLKLTLLTMRDNSRSLRDLIRLALSSDDVQLPTDLRLELSKSVTFLDDVYLIFNRLKSEIK